MGFIANVSMLFTEVPMLGRPQLAREAGFDGVECQFPYVCAAADLAEAARAAAMPWRLINLPAGDWAAGERGIACLPDRRAEFRQGVAEAIAYARVMGARKVNCLAGVLPPDLPRGQAVQTLRENLVYAAEQLQAVGIELLLEPINRHDIPGFLLATAEEATELIAPLAPGSVGLQYDLYHVARMGGEVAADLAAYGERIRHVQFADCPGRHQPGSGQSPLLAALQELRRAGYQGDFSAEYVPAGHTSQSLSWLPLFCQQLGL